MLVKNARASVAAITVALITGIMMVLWVALTSAPAQAQPGDVARLLSIKAVDITDDESDGNDEPYIIVDGNQVWSGEMRADEFVTFDIPVALSGDRALVQVFERDPGWFNSPDDRIGEFYVAYTDGTAQPQPLNKRGGEGGDAYYEMTYKVERPPVDPAPRVLAVKPTGTGVSPRTNAFATFSEPMMASTINGAAFKLYKGGVAVRATVTYNTTTQTAKLDPSANLKPGVRYKAVVSTGAKDLAGNALDQNPTVDGAQPKIWYFTVRR